MTLPTGVGASSVSRHHRRLGSMGKTKRRLSDAREASVCPMYVSVPLIFFTCFLSLSLFFCVLVRVSWLSVPVPSIVFFWISFLLFCPFFPFSFFHSHSRMFAAALVFRVSIHSLSSPLSPPTMFGFCHSFDFRSFILSDASRPFYLSLSYLISSFH